MSKLGTVEKKGFDAQGYEHRFMLAAIAVCPACGKDVELWSDTECWVKGNDGRWHPSEYDLAPHGECCGNVIIHNGLDGKTMVLHGQG